MQLRPEKRPQRYNESNLIPMINVVFLLLIFFMVAGTFKLNGPVEISDPQSTRSQVAEPERFIYIDNSGQIFVEDQLYTLGNLSTAIAERGWQHGTEQKIESTKTIHLRVDRTLSIGRFREVIVELRSIGVPEIALITEWVGPDTNTLDYVEK